MPRTLACPACGARVPLEPFEWLPGADDEARLRCPSCGLTAMLPRVSRAGYYLLACTAGISGAVIAGHATSRGWAIAGLLLAGPGAAMLVLPAFAPFWHLEPYRPWALSVRARAVLPLARWFLVATLLATTLAPIAVYVVGRVLL